MSVVLCPYCRKEIRQGNYWYGPGWSHVDSSFEGYTYCRLTEATPMEVEG
ncbi:hypothetical protein [Nocardia aurea]